MDQRYFSDFLKNYKEERDDRSFLEFDIQNPEKLHELHDDLPFLPEIMKIEKVEKLVTDLHNKSENDIHMKNLKQELNHRLILKKVHRVIKFNQKAWLKPYIDMNTKLTQKAKSNFEKDFLKLINNAIFGKTMENVRKHRNNNRKERKLFSIRTKLSHCKVFHRTFMTTEMRKLKY